MFSIISWVITGAIAGWIVSMIQKRDFRREWVNFLLLGMSGSAIGGMVYRLAGRPLGGGVIVEIGVAVGGAFLFIWLIDKLRSMQR